jgi:hypothetical protein
MPLQSGGPQVADVWNCLPGQQQVGEEDEEEEEEQQQQGGIVVEDLPKTDARLSVLTPAALKIELSEPRLAPKWGPPRLPRGRFLSRTLADVIGVSGATTWGHWPAPPAPVSSGPDKDELDLA